MRRSSHVIPLFRSRLAADGPYTTVDGATLMAGVDYFGSLYTVVTATGTGGVPTGLQAVGDNTDAQATRANGDLLVANRNYVFNGATWDRLRSASAANLALLSGTGAAITTNPGNWSVFLTPAAAAQATASKAAVAGTRHVCTSLSFSVGAVAAQTILTAVLRDGATGVGAILWSLYLGPFAIATQGNIIIDDLNIPGTAGNAMTIEFTAAPGATNFEAVAMTGYDAV